MTKFFSPPYEFDAVQWKGDNLEEVRTFVGTRATGDWDIDANQPHVIPLFNPLGTYLIPSEMNAGFTGEVWDVEVDVWRPVKTGDWIVQQEEGFVPCTDEWIRLNKVELDEETQALLDEEQRPKSFEHELTSLINRHSRENPSGTPDFILASYLTGCLDVYNKTVVHRASWRSESVELPALQKLHEGDVVAPGALDGNDGKEVPLVIYTDGQRNEVGTAKIAVTPGEMAVTATITGAIPMFGPDNVSAAYSLELPDSEEDPEALRRQRKVDVEPGQAQSAFQRYQQRGLTDNG